MSGHENLREEFRMVRFNERMFSEYSFIMESFILDMDIEEIHRWIMLERKPV